MNLNNVEKWNKYFPELENAESNKQCIYFFPKQKDDLSTISILKFSEFPFCIFKKRTVKNFQKLPNVDFSHEFFEENIYTILENYEY